MLKQILSLSAALVISAGFLAAGAPNREQPTKWAETVKLPAAEKPIKLFNGKDLTGWEGQIEKYWSVDDGTIKATNKEPVAASTYLFTKNNYRNFRLLLEIKQTRGKGFSTMHSGVCCLGEKFLDKGDPFSFKGPLLMCCNDWGYYDLNRRNRVAPPAQMGNMKVDAEKVGEWNQMEILVIGNRLRYVANGQLVIDYTDKPEMLKSSPIGLQLHSNKDKEEYHFRGLILSENPEDRLLTEKTGSAPKAASDKQLGDGFVPMFNGKDLTGWADVNCAPETFFVKDNMIITTGKPTGYLRTAKQYENFIAEFEWMHVPPGPKEVGNSGFFVWADALPAIAGNGYTRGIEVQVLVNLTYTDKKTGAVTATSQGDLFSIWVRRCKPDRPHPTGAERCLPSENNCKGANEWNHYRVYANDGVIKLTVNGKEVSGVSQCTPRKGYLALESEGSECRFKNLKIKELPSTNPAAKDIADVAKGEKSLYTGLDLRGWQANDEHKKHWKPRGWSLVYDGKGQAAESNLWTDKEYGNFELVADWKLAGNNKSGILLRGSDKGQVAITCSPTGSGEVLIYRQDKGQPVQTGAAIAPKLKADQKPGQWNRYRIRVKDDRVTVYLNNQLIIDNAQVPGIAGRGRIGLQHQGDRGDFANLFVRELGKDD